MIILFARRNLFSGRRLNIFSGTTEEGGVESTVGNEEFLLLYVYYYWYCHSLQWVIYDCICLDDLGP